MSSYTLYKTALDEDKTSSMLIQLTDDDDDMEYSKQDNEIMRKCGPISSDESSCYIDSGNEDTNYNTSFLSDIRSYCQTWDEASKYTLSHSSCANDDSLSIHDEEDKIQMKIQDRNCLSFLQFIFSIFFIKTKK